ncbi:MAG TPA: methyltransferase domain-containing protein [Longimicrobiaceae bacterium]|nr:methyltransferase domain-containing protein [Longimicrobiaceae bacterium]
MTQQTHHEPPVDPEALRSEVRSKYCEVAVDPGGEHHFHTGRLLAERLGYEARWLDGLPERVIESFAGIANVFRLRRLEQGERVVDIGSGAGFDALAAAEQVGDRGRVIGVDMTPEMLAKARANAEMLELENADFREGLAEDLPIEDGWADVVLSNGVLNLCPDKRTVFEEILRVLRPGGVLQFADIANGNPVPPAALREVDLWTG